MKQHFCVVSSDHLSTTSSEHYLLANEIHNKVLCIKRNSGEHKDRKLNKMCSVNSYPVSPVSFSSSINTLIQQMRWSSFNFLHVFSKLYIRTICKHFCFKQGCNFTYLFCLIVDLMSPKFLNMHQRTVAYKVFGFTFLTVLCISSYFFLNCFLQRVINWFDQLWNFIWGLN